MNVSSVYEGVKTVKGVVNLGYGISVCWCIDGIFGAGDGSDDRIIFGFYYGYDLSYSNGFFDTFSVDRYILRYLYESLE